MISQIDKADRLQLNVAENAAPENRGEQEEEGKRMFVSSSLNY